MAKILSYKKYREKMAEKAYLDKIMGPIKKTVGIPAWKAEARALPKEKRQAILDAMNAGKTFGEMAEVFQVTQNALLGVYEINRIRTVYYHLPTVSK